MGGTLFTNFTVNYCMYEYKNQYGKVSLRLNILDTKMFQPFGDCLVLYPNTYYYNDFLPSLLFMGETTAETHIKLYPYLPWISSFSINLNYIQSKYMIFNHSTSHYTENACMDIPTSISISHVVVNLSSRTC